MHEKYGNISQLGASNITPGRLRQRACVPAEYRGHPAGRFALTKSTGRLHLTRAAGTVVGGRKLFPFGDDSIPETCVSAQQLQ